MDRIIIMSPSERAIIRQAMLDAQSRWLSEAEGAETTAQMAIARVIADAFEREAANYKQTKEMTTDDAVAQLTQLVDEGLLSEGPTAEQPGFFGPQPS